MPNVDVIVTDRFLGAFASTAEHRAGDIANKPVNPAGLKNVMLNRSRVVPSRAALALATGLSAYGVTAVYAQGYAAVGDSPGMLMVRDDAASDHPGVTTDADGNKWRIAEPSLDWRMFGATPTQAAVDSTTAFADCLEARTALGVPIIFDGEYYLAEAGAQLDPGESVSVYGRDPASSLIRYHEGTDAVPKSVFFNQTGNLKGSLHFENFTIQGTLATRLIEDGPAQVEEGGPTMNLRFYQSVTMKGMQFKEVSKQGFVLEWVYDVLIDGCFLKDIARGAIYTGMVNRGTFVNNTIERCGDDPISLHANIGYTGITPSLAADIIVSGNLIRNAGGAIKSLGGRRMQISDNILELCNDHAIMVGDNENVSWGQQAPHSIIITGNVCLDTHKVDLAAAATNVIAIEVRPARGADADGDTMPTRYYAAGARFVYPWDHFNTRSSVAENAVPHGTDIVIESNVIARTRPNVAAFSSYGYGSYIRFPGGIGDTATTDTIMRPLSGIDVRGPSVHRMSVKGNLISHTIRAFGMITIPDGHGHINGLLAEGNILFDFTEYGFFIQGPSDVSTLTLAAAFRGNWINGDYYRQNANSNIDGTYDTNGTPHAFNFVHYAGAVIEGNTAANVCNLINLPNNHVVRNNTLYCGAPAATGFDVGNKGIGNIPLGNSGWAHIIVDADPTSANYMAYDTIPAFSRTAKPTVGTYVAGHFVWNTAPTVDIRDTLIGWIRLTTGSGHVSNVDWNAVWAPTSPTLLSWAGAKPTSGTYTAGHFVINTSPVVTDGRTLLGWARLTTGSDHVSGTDWSTVWTPTTSS